MNADWYIYYRVRTERAPLLKQRVAAMQQHLQQRSGVVCSLKKRPQAKDGLETWMEVYLAVPDDFDHVLARELHAAEVAPLIEGDRHTEYFVDIQT